MLAGDRGRRSCWRPRNAVERRRRGDSSLDWLPLIESSVNDLIFAAIALYFLFTSPSGSSAGTLLDLLHRLRSLAHVIDMHQLTKDPERLKPELPADLGQPRREPGPGRDGALPRLLLRAAQPDRQDRGTLCAEKSRDSVVLTTVSTLETLTNDMSRKIWQKIQLLPPVTSQ